MKVLLAASTIVAASLAATRPIQAQGTGTSPSSRHDISGYWRFNPQASDNASAILPRDEERGGGAAGGGGFGGGGRRGGMGGGRGGGGGGMGGRPGMSDAGRARNRQTMQLAMDAPTTLLISHDDSTVTLVEVAIAETIRLRTNGKKIKEKVEGAGDLEIKAEWKDDGLILERKVDGGGKVTETFFRSSDNRQMMVIVKLETSRSPKPVEFRRVYDSVTGGS